MTRPEELKTIAALGHSSNLISVPSGLLASTSFNDFPLPIGIKGVRETHHDLFQMLGTMSRPEMASAAFQNYMTKFFSLNRKQTKERRFHASYLQVLKNWLFDSNSQGGAILKGWVESRFGLFPTFHKAPIRRFNSETWLTYVEEKMSSHFNNNDIHTQIDLLYEFCQWSLTRFFSTGKKHHRLYRGTNLLREHQIVHSLDSRSAILRLNNLSSFTSNRMIADEFGDFILEVEVPWVKILFFSKLLLSPTLQSESEYLVIGGDYLVKMYYC